MGKARNRDRARSLRSRTSTNNITVQQTPLKICYWNCNGITNHCKLQEINDIMESEQLDVLFIDETHLKKGTNEDMTLLDKWTPTYLERDFGLKNGGGKIVLKSPKLKYLEWNPIVKDKEWVSSERTWIFVYKNGSNIAICSVYMAAEITANDDYKLWNESLYETIQGELRGLENEGYKCMIMGDMNAHIGTPPLGIDGNKPGTNSNGRKLLDFVSNNNLVILNRNKELCTGTFTRITPYSSTILDYVLITKNLQDNIIRMGIDDEVSLFSGSDHVALRVDISVPQIHNEERTTQSKERPLILHQERDLKTAKVIMDKAFDECDWDEISLDEKCKVFQEIIVSANLEAYGNAPRTKVKRQNKHLKRLQYQKKTADQKSKKLSLERTNIILNHGIWSEENQELLEQAVIEGGDLGTEINKKKLELAMSKSNKKRIKETLKTEKFWKVAQRTLKKKGLLTSIKDADGKLVTDYLMLKETIVTEVAKMALGQKSKLFTSRGQQLIKEVTILTEKNYQKWIPKEREEFEFEHEVCKKVLVEDVKKVVKEIKSDRASGVDRVSATMLQAASEKGLKLLTSLVNESIQEGRVPEILQVGKMTLIDKKEPSLEVNKKRPLTVSSVVLSVLTKIVHKRMNEICEREGFYGHIQYGFRQKRSTVDCVFMILAALRAAKRKHKAISLAFCDIAKAYDTVCRELLYTKLRNIGFGGKVVALIRSMYYNDCVRVNLAQGLSDPVYFTQGVKQGCSLSPMLFALYIASLGTALHNTNLGIEFGHVTLTALFFADDLLLLSSTPKGGMNKLLNLVTEFCNDMRMKLSVTKTYILTNAQYNVSWTVEDETIEEILIAKYLGVHIQLRGRSIIGKYEENVVRRATNYAYSIMNLSRSVLDRAIVAKRLWESCAIPAILYCSEATIYKQCTIRELERIQNMVGRFILQLPRSSSNTMGWIDAGLMPMENRIQNRQAIYIWNIMNTKGNNTLQLFLRELLNHPSDAYTKNWLMIQKDIGIITNFERKTQLSKALVDRAVTRVLAIKRSQSTMSTLPQPWKWFKIQPHISDTYASKTMSMVRAGNAQLGNRYKNRYGYQYKHCPHCILNGTTTKLKESHVILACPSVELERRKLRITNYIVKLKAQGKTTNQELLRSYLGGDGAEPEILIYRGKCMATIIEMWLYRNHE